MFRRWMMFGMLLFIAASLSAAEPKSPKPIVALGFENPSYVKAFFGMDGKAVPGLHGKGLTGLHTGYLKNPSPNEGTLMLWLKQTRREPTGAFQYRWTKFSTGGQLGPMGATLQVGWYKGPGIKRRDVIELDDWHHWTVCWQGNRMTVYLDGELLAEGKDKSAEGLPNFSLGFEEGQTRFIADDLKIYDKVLSPEQILASMKQRVANDVLPGGKAPKEPIEKPAELPKPVGVSYGPNDQLMENGFFSPRKNSFKLNALPRGWGVGHRQGTITTDANGLLIKAEDGKNSSVISKAISGKLIPGRVYRIGVYYRLGKSKGRALLRLRNQIDMGTKEFELPPTEGFVRKFFFTQPPEDYDVGLYYLEPMLEGPGELGIRGVYCREATAEEVKKAGLSIPAAARKMPATVVPDEKWIQQIPRDFRFMTPVQRSAAWAKNSDGDLLKIALKQEGQSLWFVESPKALFAKLSAMKKASPENVLRLAVSRVRNDVPGGNGLNPLPPRSTQAAGLLMGVGVCDTGIGSYAFFKLTKQLKTFGYFEPETQFIPFWSQKPFYKLRAENLKAPVDYRTAFKSEKDILLKKLLEKETPKSDPDAESLALEEAKNAPLFGHTAPGVLVSGYKNGDSLLLVVVNTTDQKLGKNGDLWVDHARIFGVPEGQVNNMMRKGGITAVDLDTGAKGGIHWNRNKGGGYISDIWALMVIPPGDYRLILVTCNDSNKKK